MIKTNKDFIKTFLFVFVFFFSVQVFGQSDAADPYIKTGRDHFNLFQYDKAFENFKRATDVDQRNWEANFYAGKCLIKLKRIDEAEKYLSKALSLNPTELEVQKTLGAVYLNLAKVAQTNGQNSKKIDYQIKACHAYPGATKIWLSLFEQWWDNAEYGKIKTEGEYLYKNCNDILDEGEDVNLQQALVLVAKAYHNDGDLVKAESFLNQASKIRAQNDELYGLKRQIKNQEEEKVNKILSQAEYDINKKNYEKAVDALKMASKMSAARQAELESKIEELEKLISERKYHDEIKNLIAKEDYEKASTVIAEAIQAFPSNEEFREKAEFVNNKLEEIQEKIYKEEEAKKREETQKRNREYKVLSLKRNAEKLEKDKEYEKAIEELKNALKLAPKDVEIKSKIEQLEADFKKAKERQNRYVSSIDEINELYKSKNYEDCVDKSKSLLDDYPEYAASISIPLTQSYLKLEKYDAAASASIPLENIDITKDLYNFANGLAKYHSGQNDEAKKHLEEVKKGESEYVGEAKKLLNIMFIKKIQIGIYLFIIIIIITVTPKVKDYLKHSREASMSNKLERIKETGNYEANYKFLQQRYEKDDVPNRKLVMLLYAAALQKNGENELAYQLISEYLKKDARSPLAKNIAGETAMALGETSPIALEQVQGLLKLNENRKDAVEYLAKAYISTKADHKLAQEYISKYIALKPTDTAAITYLADVYISRQTYNEQSVKTLEKAVKANPDKPEYLIALKDNYKNIGNQDEADRVQALISEKFPDYSAPTPQQPYDPYSYPQDYGQQSNYAQMGNYGQQAAYDQQASYDQQTNYSQQPGYDQQYSNQQSNYYQQNNANQNTNNQNDYEQRILMQQQMFMQQNSVPQQNTLPQSNGGFPDYDSIGGDALPTLDDLTANLSGNNDNLQNFGDLIKPNKDISSRNMNKASEPQIQGPKKNCPYCGSANPASEYYCTTCGKPF